MSSWNRAQDFPSTHWTKVLAAAREPQTGNRASLEEAREALTWLCERYWQPLYRYTVWRCGDADQAKDLTQEFVAALIERHWLDIADPERGKFRAFLLTALKRFLAQRHRLERTLKRGGGSATVDALDPSAASHEALRDDVSPDVIYERQWALNLLSRVTNSLREEFAEMGRSDHFECLKGFLTSEGNVREASVRLGMTENAARVAIHRLRKQFRSRFNEEIEQTVASPEQAREEARYLLEVLVSTRGSVTGEAAS
jgi:DNA-directed RNA polymerase specialized sigma24 family protein